MGKFYNHFENMIYLTKFMENKNNSNTNEKAWVVAVDMGYGHQRTAYALRQIAYQGKVINANHYDGIPSADKDFWQRSQTYYEFVSRFRRVPIIGVALFLFMDSFQKILRYYPRRDLSKSTLSGRSLNRFIRRGWLKHLIEKLARNPVTLISTFSAPSQAAEYFHYPNNIYCVICDADVSRAWVALDAKRSRIKYFASSSWSRDRLKLYGVPAENILYTGYPLPQENIGKNQEIVRRDVGYRLLNLDPEKKYRNLYAPLIKSYLGELPALPDHPLTIMFSIGGAGAQKEIALAIVKSLQSKIKARQLRFIISVGTHEEMRKYFARHLKGLEIGDWLQILWGETPYVYFEKFNQALRTTDILMTKPSELSFYAGLGIPIIIEPPLGSQEDFNQNWLLHIGAGVMQENPIYTDQWIEDFLHGGEFAEMAMQGFVEIEKMGTYAIEKIIAEDSTVYERATVRS